MNIRSKLLEGNNPEIPEAVIHYVGSDRRRFEQLLQLFLDKDYRMVQRATIPLLAIAKQHPGFIKENEDVLINKISEADVPNAVLRNALRLYSNLKPEDLPEALMDLCFRIISKPSSPIAVKAFSLKILDRMCKKFPEISSELSLAIEGLPKPLSPALISVIKKIRF